jgi:preprotein translocase subunit SecA
MTGTAITEAAEFGEIYRLEVVEIPTNVTVMRNDADDEIYRHLTDKTRAIVKLIKDVPGAPPADAGRHGLDREIEALSDALKKAGIRTAC